MYHVECIDIHKGAPLFMYIDRASLCANNMYNAANFCIRNLMTGLKKDIRERTENESSVIDTVNGSVSGINDRLREKYDRKVRKIRETAGLSDGERAERIQKVKRLQFSDPTAEKWFASYELLDAVFKFTDNPDYRAFHAHVIQNAIKACCLAWNGFFESLKKYSPSSCHTGKPKIPGYKKSGGRTTAVFSNLACSIKHGMLFFPYYREDSDGADGQGKRQSGSADAAVSVSPACRMRPWTNWSRCAWSLTSGCTSSRSSRTTALRKKNSFPIEKTSSPLMGRLQA